MYTQTSRIHVARFGVKSMRTGVADLRRLDRYRRGNCDKFNTTGKSSIPIILIDVKPQIKKYFAFPEEKISCISIAVSRSQEGRFAVVTDVGQEMRWTRPF